MQILEGIPADRVSDLGTQPTAPSPLGLAPPDWLSEPKESVLSVSKHLLCLVDPRHASTCNCTRGHIIALLQPNQGDEAPAVPTSAALRYCLLQALFPEMLLGSVLCPHPVPPAMNSVPPPCVVQGVGILHVRVLCVAMRALFTQATTSCIGQLLPLESPPKLHVSYVMCRIPLPFALCPFARCLLLLSA